MISPWRAHLQTLRRAAVELHTLWHRAPRPVPPLPFGPAAVLALAAITVAILVTVALAFDAAAIAQVRRLPWSVIRFFEGVTRFGASSVYLWPLGFGMMCLVLWRASGLRVRARAGATVLLQRLTLLFGVVALTGLAATLLKRLIGRARPKHLDTLGPFHLDGFAVDASMASFPSGHATTAFALAVALGCLTPRWRPVWLAAAGLIALSRVMIGSHYPSDVVAGALLGSVGAWLLLRRFCTMGLALRVDGEGRTGLRGQPQLRALRSLVGRRRHRAASDAASAGSRQTA